MALQWSFSAQIRNKRTVTSHLKVVVRMGSGLSKSRDFKYALVQTVSSKVIIKSVHCSEFGLNSIILVNFCYLLIPKTIR